METSVQKKPQIMNRNMLFGVEQKGKEKEANENEEKTARLPRRLTKANVACD